MPQYEYVVLDLIESAARNSRIQPLNLGGIAGAGGGIGGPAAGFVGRLPQYQVTYDTTEAATLDTMPSGVTGASGWSLVDNLNHIRARLNRVEASGILTVDDWDGSPTIQGVTELTFSGAILSQLGSGHVLVVVSGGAGGGTPLTVQKSGGITITNVDTIIFSGAGVGLYDLGGGDAKVVISGGGGGSDATYLRLDATNDPVTGPLTIQTADLGSDNYSLFIENNDSTSYAAIWAENKYAAAAYLTGHNDSALYITQTADNGNSIAYPTIYADRTRGDLSTVAFTEAGFYLLDHQGQATYSKGLFRHVMMSGATPLTLAEINSYISPTEKLFHVNSLNDIAASGRFLSLAEQGVEKVFADGLGNFYIPSGATYNINGTPHTHTGNVIYSEDVTLIAGTFDFQNIPATGSLIEIIFEGRSDRVGQNSDGAKIKFNNDGGNNYIGVIQWGGATPGWTPQTAAGAPIVFTYTPANSSPANWFSNSKIIIPNYASSHYKDWQARGMQVVTTGGNIWIYDAAGQWQSTSAISRVTIYPENGTNFANGSRATLRVYA